MQRQIFDMNNNFKQTKTLNYFRVRTAKEYSSFMYFILEAHDSMAFYSTTDQSLKMEYRDIDIYCTPEFSEEVRHIFQHFQGYHSLEVLKDELLFDQA
jgi:hypothetical protein